jgi:hypothetical protein
LKIKQGCSEYEKGTAKELTVLNLPLLLFGAGYP